jgi:hypothetical protein
MRRHAPHTSDASAGTRARADAPALPMQVGNRAVAGLLGPRGVQRAPADLGHPEEIDYWNLKGPKSLDSGFKAGGGTKAMPDAGFTVPHKGGDGLDLGYGGTGDATFLPDYRHDGGRQSGGVSAMGKNALHGRDPLGGHATERNWLPDTPVVPSALLPTPGGPAGPGDALAEIAGSVGLGGVAEAATPGIEAVSSFAHEIPFLGDLL